MLFGLPPLDAEPRDARCERGCPAQARAARLGIIWSRLADNGGIGRMADIARPTDRRWLCHEPRLDCEVATNADISGVALVRVDTATLLQDHP
jgi:hypothetical protein